MSKPISLARTRKARTRAARKAHANANAAKFGRNRAERAADDLAKDMARRALDGHQRQP